MSSLSTRACWWAWRQKAATCVVLYDTLNLIQNIALVWSKIYENSCKTHIRVLSYFVRLILSGNVFTVLKLVEQELPIFPENLSSPPVFSGVRVTRSFVLCVIFCRSLFVLCTFSFGHCVVCLSSICGFWLPLWYLQTLLIIIAPWKKFQF